MQARSTALVDRMFICDIEQAAAESFLTATFDADGLDEAIKPLRASCI